MKTLVILAIVIMMATDLQAQSFPSLDKSPLDLAYFPDNFAHDREDGEEAILRIMYSRPQKKGREIMGKKVKYGSVWRLGANEAAEIKVYRDITIQGTQIKAGTYALFAIPEQAEWTLILNKGLDYWGSYSYDEAQDAYRFRAPVSSSEDVIEAFSIVMEADGDNGGTIWLGWENTLVGLPFRY